MIPVQHSDYWYMSVRARHLAQLESKTLLLLHCCQPVPLPTSIRFNVGGWCRSTETKDTRNAFGGPDGRSYEVSIIM